MQHRVCGRVQSAHRDTAARAPRFVGMETWGVGGGRRRTLTSCDASQTLYGLQSHVIGMSVCAMGLVDQKTDHTPNSGQICSPAVEPIGQEGSQRHQRASITVAVVDIVSIPVHCDRALRFLPTHEKKRRRRRRARAHTKKKASPFHGASTCAAWPLDGQHRVSAHNAYTASAAAAATPPPSSARLLLPTADSSSGESLSTMFPYL